MKKLFFSLLLSTSVLFLGCEGPEGPQGVPGPQGPAGPAGQPGQNGQAGVNAIFDFEGSLNSGNDYRVYFDFPPEEIEVFETDAVLVYRLWEELEDPSGPIPVWRLLPQTVLMPQGIMQYNFDHSFLDASVFIDAQFDRATLGAEWTQNQTFRVVIIPASYTENLRVKGVDLSNYEEVKKYYQIDESSIKKYKARTKQL
ncbi:collagen-like triple helix repeat-containing protein [Telluribacter humicola]|uniref:collagen-like triple helix repeat-containing protein n=1 Tax=Telluribacter humicola TaxID=1720261 RepID=UPI001A962E4B|nr:collagen-like protein [Telluribacter humicola]